MSTFKNTITIENMSKPSVDEFKHLHDDLPKPPFTMAFVAPSRAGKSNCIANLLLRDDMLKNVFGKNRIFIFCPTVDLTPDYEDVDTKYKFNTFDENKVHDIMSKQKTIIKNLGKDKAYHLLLLFDDCFDDARFHKSKFLNTLCMRGRHMNISCIFSGQRLKAMSRSVRLNLTHLVVFRPNNLSEMDQLAEEYIAKDQRKHAVEVFKSIFETPYSFIVFDNLSKDWHRRIRANFTEPLDLV